MFSLAGLSFGSALGFAGAFGGFQAFVLVLLLGVVGLLAGRALTGELDLGELLGTVVTRRKSP
ncbi:hypothetical protein DPM19_08620 [Actinomadura craniellae]|uniref:DUF2273 domain-containing protein n=1 Tax=Actinomadura craniellae TaxID=2231787 RepID=A0A365HA58_9ACTN|nr:hypothetical protein [Actinomadura craniellae]RAY16020.1 hypothetical protein DPM19_08620 [Actinomadura craniellae]